MATYFMFELANKMHSSTTAQLFWKQETLTSAELEKITQGEEDVKVSAFSKGRQEEISTYVLDYKVEAEVIEGVGNIEAITSGEKTCIIDTHVAKALFGGTDVVDQMIKIGDRDYTISGIIEGNKGTIYCLASRDTRFSNLLVTLMDTTNTRVDVEKFLMKYQLPKANLMIITNELEFLVEVIVRVPIFICYSFFLSLGFYILKGIVYKHPIKCAIGGTCLVLLGYLFAAALFDLTIPQSLIPNRWSNAVFYKEIIQQVKEQFAYFMNMEKPPCLQVMQKHFLSLLGWGVVFIIASGSVLLAFKSKRTS